MRRSESVVDVEVGERRQPIGEGAVVRLLSGIEPEILEQNHLSGLDVRANGRGGLSYNLVERHHVAAKQLRQAVGHRSQPQVLDDRALRATEVRREHERGSPVEELVQRRKGRADPEIVRDLPCIKRDVEVHANENPFPGYVAEVVEGSQHQSCEATSWTRSTSRFE